MIICDMCGKQFAKRYFLKIHMYSKHNIKDPTVKVSYKTIVMKFVRNIETLFKVFFSC